MGDHHPLLSLGDKALLFQSSFDVVPTLLVLVKYSDHLDAPADNCRGPIPVVMILQLHQLLIR